MEGPFGPHTVVFSRNPHVPSRPIRPPRATQSFYRRPRGRARWPQEAGAFPSLRASPPGVNGSVFALFRAAQSPIFVAEDGACRRCPRKRPVAGAGIHPASRWRQASFIYNVDMSDRNVTDKLRTTTVKPTYRWYQFSLRSLLLLCVFVAVLCSVGVCVHWAIPAAVASVVTIGGVAGGVVARTRSGLVQGVVVAVQFSLIVFLIGLFALPAIRRGAPAPWGSPWLAVVAMGFASLLGGCLGGDSVRPQR